MSEPREIQISFCTYQGGAFDLMIYDKKTGRELCFTGIQGVSDYDLSLIKEIAPACVWTSYTRTTPED